MKNQSENSTGGGAHTTFLREQLRARFLHTCRSMGEGQKVLVVESSLIGVLDVTFKLSELESAGIFKISQWTEDWSETAVVDESPSAPITFIYLIRSLSAKTLPLFTAAAAAISARKSKQIVPRHLLFCPYVCELGLTRLRSLLNVEDLSTVFASVSALPSLMFSTIDEDTISLESGGEAEFLSVHGRDDPSSLVGVAHALCALQRTFGVGVGHEGEVRAEDRKFRKINAIGTASKFVADTFLRLSESPVKETGARDGPRQGMAERDGEHVMTGFSRIGGIQSVGGLLLDANRCSTDLAVGGKGAVDESLIPKLNPWDAIDSLVLIDRRTDLYSLLCSQFTYTALVDDVYTIKNRKVTFPSAGEDNSQSTTMLLSKESDSLYGEIRDVSVARVGKLLSSKANYIAECYREKDSLKSISELKEFMDKFKEVQIQHASLSNHVALATNVCALANDGNMAYLLKVEDQIMSMSKPVLKILSKLDSLIRRRAEAPNVFTLERCLKLLCLTSLVYGSKAVTHAGLDKVLRTLVQVHGLSAVNTVHRLEKTGLLAFHNPAEASGVISELVSSGSKWPKIREEFKLISEDELSEPYSGYVPLSVRLVQLLSTSWKTSVNKLNLLRGPAVEIAQDCPVTTGGAGNFTTVAVVFLGGVTYAEIAALRRLSISEGGRRRFLIVTTGITKSYSRAISTE